MLSSNIKVERLTLEDAIKHPRNGAGASRESLYLRRKECESPEWEGEWARVQRMRREGHPLMKGGHYRYVKPYVGYMSIAFEFAALNSPVYKGKDKHSYRKFHLI